MRTRSRRRTLTAVAAVVAATLPASACSEVGKPLDIGMSYDRPGLGIRAWEQYSGFDHVLAKDLARRLGYEGRRRVSYHHVPERRSAPTTDKLPYDVLVAAYPATDALRARGDLVGPYLRGGQDIAVRADDRDSTTPETLSGRIVCLVAGTAFGDAAPSTFPGAQITYRQTLSTCLTELRQKSVDAVSDEGLALRGYAAEAPFAGTVRVVGAPFPPTDYYLVVSKADAGLCLEVKDALQAAVSDGTWSRAYESQLVRTGVSARVPAPPPRITGCGS